MATETSYPEHADIQFGRQTRTGIVHVLPYRPEWREEESEPAEFGDLSLTEQADAILGRSKVLCGYEAFTAPGGRLEYVGPGDFPDEALCIKCVRSLGPDSWRAFHRPDGYDLLGEVPADEH